MKMRIGSLLSIALSTLFLISCGSEQQPEEIIRPVRYLQAYSTGGSRVRSFTGVVHAGLESKLSFKVRGTVERVAVKVGDKVQAGDLIARLDKSDYELQVQQAEAAVANAQAQARNAEASYERVRALYENNSTSRTELDGARAANESASASVRSAEKQLELARLQLGYTVLTSPTDGAIAQVNVEINENAESGKMVVLLASESKPEVNVSIPEILIGQIREGQTVSVTCDAIPGRELPAAVAEVGISATGGGSAFPVTVRMERDDPAIRPGMAASVAFQFQSTDNRIRFLVPSHAVLEDRAGRYLFVAEPMADDTRYGTVRRHPVTVGDLTADGLEVFTGITDGDFIITAGMSRIIEGQKVKL